MAFLFYFEWCFLAKDIKEPIVPLVQTKAHSFGGAEKAPEAIVAILN